MMKYARTERDSNTRILKDHEVYIIISLLL